uniref:Tyrosine-protein kinase CpsD n=1 Tax=Streptococcus suis TaxID=1307 RepID=E9NQ10_STRSU|nr:CPS16C [Streptococcus suis]
MARTKKGLVNKTEGYFNAILTNIQLQRVQILKWLELPQFKQMKERAQRRLVLLLLMLVQVIKTVLVDADIRNSVMSGFFKPVTKITGLTDYLAGTTDLSQGLCDTDIPNLTVIESGKISPNPTALLQSKNFENLLATLRRYYDYVIVDCPPLGLVIDAAIIAQRCDAMVLIAEAGSVKRSSLKKVKEQLDQTGTPFLGVILNKYDIITEKYGEYGNYGNYGKKA